MSRHSEKPRTSTLPFQIVVFSVAIYLSSLYSYTLFHSLVETFTSVVALGMFVIAWASRRYIYNNFLLIIGVGYFFIGGLDLLHMLSYKGMGIFNPESEMNLSTQLWIAARYMEAIAFIAAFLFFTDQKSRSVKQKNVGKVFFAFLSIFILALLSIFYWKNFPTVYVEGMGMTSFKKISEYVICIFFVFSMFLLYRKRSLFDREIGGFLFISLGTKIASEIYFTEYVSILDFSNAAGHLLKFISFLLLYKAVLEGGLMRPYRFMFADLKKSEENLRKSRERYRDVIDNQKEMVCRYSSDGIVTFANTAYCNYFGKTRQQLLGKKFLPDIHSEDIGKRNGCVQSLTVDSPFCETEYRVISSGGEPRWIASNMMGIFNSAGELMEVQFVGWDITERKIAEKKLAKENLKHMTRIEKQLMKSYEYLGAVNRRISLLLDIDTHSQEANKKNRQKIADYVLDSALNLSQAKLGLLYKGGGDGIFYLTSRSGSFEEEEKAPRFISLEKAGNLSKLLNEKVRVNGPSEVIDPRIILENAKISYIVALPFIKSKECRGFMLLGFDKIKSIDKQELEFLDVFALHASNALSRAGVLNVSSKENGSEENSLNLQLGL